MKRLWKYKHKERKLLKHAVSFIQDQLKRHIEKSEHKQTLEEMQMTLKAILNGECE